MKVKAIDIKTNEIIFESEDGDEVIKKANESGKEYILDFEEGLEENLFRKSNIIY